MASTAAAPPSVRPVRLRGRTRSTASLAGRPTRCPWMPSTPGQPLDAGHGDWNHGGLLRAPAAERARRRILVRRRLRRNPGGRVRQRQRRNHFRRELDDCRQERRRAQLRRSQRPGDGCGRRVARSHDRDDARGMGATDLNHVMAHRRHQGATEQSRLRAVRKLRRSPSQRHRLDRLQGRTGHRPRFRRLPTSTWTHLATTYNGVGGAPLRERLTGRDPRCHRRDAELESAAPDRR